MTMPMLDILQANNIFSGSEGDFRFKVIPADGKMKVWAYKIYCLDYCKEHNLVLGEMEFTLNEIGMEELRKWLEGLAFELSKEE